MTKVIALVGGPGVGKSTVATGLFSALKQRKVSCEYVAEYAKEIVWEGTDKLLENQIHIFAEQFRRQYRLLGKVDYIITDSPLCLSSVYLEEYLQNLKYDDPKRQFFKREIALKKSTMVNWYSEIMKEYMDETFKCFDNLTYFLGRSKEYDTRGRTQTLEQAEQLDRKIKSHLYNNNILFQTLNGGEQENITKIITDLFDKVEVPKAREELTKEWEIKMRQRWLDGEHTHCNIEPKDEIKND